MQTEARRTQPGPHLCALDSRKERVALSFALQLQGLLFFVVVSDLWLEVLLLALEVPWVVRLLLAEFLFVGFLQGAECPSTATQERKERGRGILDVNGGGGVGAGQPCTCMGLHHGTGSAREAAYATRAYETGHAAVAPLRYAVRMHARGSPAACAAAEEDVAARSGRWCGIHTLSPSPSAGLASSVRRRFDALLSDFFLSSPSFETLRFFTATLQNRERGVI